MYCNVACGRQDAPALLGPVVFDSVSSGRLLVAESGQRTVSQGSGAAKPRAFPLSTLSTGKLSFFTLTLPPGAILFFWRPLRVKLRKRQGSASLQLAPDAFLPSPLNESETRLKRRKKLKKDAILVFLVFFFLTAVSMIIFGAHGFAYQASLIPKTDHG